MYYIKLLLWEGQRPGPMRTGRVRTCGRSAVRGWWITGVRLLRGLSCLRKAFRTNKFLSFCVIVLFFAFPENLAEPPACLTPPSTTLSYNRRARTRPGRALGRAACARSRGRARAKTDASEGSPGKQNQQKQAIQNT